VLNASSNKETMRMNTVRALGIGVALCGLGVLSAPASRAQFGTGALLAKGAGHATKSAAYIPAKGGATRKLIADAMRRGLGAKTGVYAVFNFDWIKVNGSWAYAETRPESPDGKSKYEPVWALLRRTDGVWSVKSLILSGEDSAPEDQRQAARRKFPSAPRDIFPHS
jgi:hypothetical protein